jgi:RimJ/RimL family protein N-acetyltransferase
VLWYDLATAAGRFTLSPVKPDRDLPVIHRWMNDPEVAVFWDLAGSLDRTADHVYGQIERRHVQPLLARLSGRPIGYWELYQAAEDPLARYYTAQPQDLGVHLLIGEGDCRGLGLGSLMLRALVGAVQREQPRRLVAEPDACNLASIRAFTAAGFTPAGTLELPTKRATLMVRDAPAQEAN